MVSKTEVGVTDEHTELSKRTNCLWQGTNVVSGTAKAMVIETGNNTIFGSIVQSTSTNIETTFEKGIKDFGYFLMKITLGLSVFILVVNLLNHKSVIESALFVIAGPNSGAIPTANVNATKVCNRETTSNASLFRHF